MLSMCGFLCRVLRGWRHQEAVSLMASALAQPDASFLVHDIAALNMGLVQVHEPGGTSSFCQNSTECSVEYVIWRDNNKQAVVIKPRQCVDLMRWTLFIHLDNLSEEATTAKPHLLEQENTLDDHNVAMNGSSKQQDNCVNRLAVLLEASYYDHGEEFKEDPIMVEHLGQPYAWKARDTFGVIVMTTPTQLLTMVRAFFTNSLIMDDDFIVTKILTVDLVGEASTLSDPTSIPETVTPGPWARASAGRTQMEIARSLTPRATPGMSEVSSSNPNLCRSASPFVRGMPHSSSFTASPYRRPHAATSYASPAKRPFVMAAGGLPSSGEPGTPLKSVKEEEYVACRKNIDTDLEKPPNVLIYAANKVEYFESVRDTLYQCLNPDRYTLYHLTDEIAFKSPWLSSTTLLIVCGDVPAHVSTSFIRYLLMGGRVLSICSDFLNVAIPLFGTVEVQEEAVVSMSYRKWPSVQLLHHQHCFHSSPKNKRFSCNLEHKKEQSKSAVSVEPTHVEIRDEYGHHHRLDLRVLATDDTWGAPSLLAASVAINKGKAIFSQVHLERDPRECGSEVKDKKKLEISNNARLEILRDLLSNELSLDVSSVPVYNFGPAYFLGTHELQKGMLQKLEPHMIGKELKRPDLTMRFLSIKEKPGVTTEDKLPVIMNACPRNFSTVKYFETLKTSWLGRLVLYSDVMVSSMHVTKGHPPLSHGLAVVPNQQTGGKGRGGNAWLSPLGCAMFTVQLHIALGSNLGQHITFVQHLVAMAVVRALRHLPGYQDIPLRLKWPNDIYFDSETKIGGVIVDSSTVGKEMIVNAGCGINLSNSNPTVCINDLICQHNEEHGTNLKELDRETFLTLVFNQLEDLINTFQSRGPEAVIPDYYQWWLHGNQSVEVQDVKGQTQPAVITGIDNFGFLEARLESGPVISLQPDGNSFDMMQGLIYTKMH